MKRRGPEPLDLRRPRDVAVVALAGVTLLGVLIVVAARALDRSGGRVAVVVAGAVIAFATLAIAGPRWWSGSTRPETGAGWLLTAGMVIAATAAALLLA